MFASPACDEYMKESLKQSKADKTNGIKEENSEAKKRRGELKLGPKIQEYGLAK